MNICNKCNRVFEEPRLTLDYEGEVSPNTISVDYVSPCCADDFQQAEQCKKCGEWFPVQFLENGICTDCFMELIKKFRYVVTNNFTTEELVYIDEKSETDGGICALVGRGVKDETLCRD